MNKVTRYTTAPNLGKKLKCPKCSSELLVYHFSFISLKCLACKNFIDKYDWILP